MATRGFAFWLAWSGLALALAICGVAIAVLYAFPSIDRGILVPLASPLALALGIGAFVATRRGPRIPRRLRLGWAALIFSVLSAFLGGSVFLHVARWWGCTQYANSLCVSLEMYLVDFGAYPRAATWSDDMREYFGNAKVLHCLERYDLRCGYAFSQALSGLRPDQVTTDPFKTVAFFDSDRGWNAAGGPELLPRKPRHLGSDIYIFAKPGTLSGSLPRRALSDGTAGIFWDPRARKQGP